MRNDVGAGGIGMVLMWGMVDFCFFFFKQKTAYEIYQCDWSSDVCSSDLEQNRKSDIFDEVFEVQNSKRKEID